MNFVELCKLYATHGRDRNAIASALGLSVDQVDEMQREAMKIAETLPPETIIGNTGAGPKL